MLEDSEVLLNISINSYTYTIKKKYMKSLNEIYQNYSAPDHHGDKGTIHTYIEIYERVLEKYRTNSTVLEIGIYNGLSLRMWNDYFIDSKIYGIDIHMNEFTNQLINENYNLIIGNACDVSILNNFNDVVFDVIVDDGSHVLSEQVMTFNLFKSKMKNGGVFIIEDVLNIDSTKSLFEGLHDNCEIIDNRHIKNRHDDVMVIYRF